MSFIPTWPSRAGHLCATHLGEPVEIGGFVGRIQMVRHDLRNSHVQVILQSLGDRRCKPFYLLDDDVVRLAP
jgi:hypothetical protein